MTKSRVQSTSDNAPTRFRGFVMATTGAASVLWLFGVGTRFAKGFPTDTEDLLSLAALFITLSCLATALLGIPLFLCLRQMGWLSGWSCTVAGAAAGSFFFFVPYAIGYGFLQVVDTRLPEIMASTVAGATGGFLFSRVRKY